MAVKWDLNWDFGNGRLPESHMIVLCFWESTSYIAEATNLSLARSVSLLYNQNSAFLDDGIAHLIRRCHCSSNPTFSARLQTTFALLMPRLWRASPPDKIFHLVIISVTTRLLLTVVLVFLSHLILHFASGLWSLSDKHSWFPLCWINTVWFLLFSQLWQSMCATGVMPLKDMTAV